MQLQAKLDELRALPGETEWVEFKHAERNFHFDDLGEYFSALSNEANLKVQPFGWLVFGVKDRTHDVITSIEMYQLPPPDFRVPPGSTQVILLAPQTFAEMYRVERVRACYQHWVLCWVSNKPMTNATLRQRFGIAEENYSMASRVIRDTIQEKLIKKANPEDTSKRHAKYISFWI